MVGGCVVHHNDATTAFYSIILFQLLAGHLSGRSSVVSWRVVVVVVIRERLFLFKVSTCSRKVPGPRLLITMCEDCYNIHHFGEWQYIYSENNLNN